MTHLGDITKISGYTVPAVDVLIGGSPCQDLSVAGLRKGLKHEANGDEETTRSGSPQTTAISTSIPTTKKPHQEHSK